MRTGKYRISLSVFLWKRLLPLTVVCCVACQASFSYGDTFTDFTAFDAATQNLTVEHFDSAPWPGVQQSGLAGTTNFGIAWYSANDLTSTQTVARSGITSISDVNGPVDSLDTITAYIGVDGVTAFGGYVHNFYDFGQNDTITMTAFDGMNNLLGAVSATSPSNFKFLGITSVAEIVRVEFRSSGPVPNDDFALDDVHFGERIPEPATLGVLALGAVAVFRRRRKVGVLPFYAQYREADS